MPITITCPSCNSPLRVREEYAGKQLQCPRCSAVITVSNADAAPTTEVPLLEVEEHVEERQPVARAIPPHRAVVINIEEARPDRRPGAPAHHPSEGPREGRRPRPRGPDYVPCPRCGAGGAEGVIWTPWGSFYGPALLTHVRCLKCGYAYNGRTGGSNTVAAVFFVLVPLILILAIVFGLLVALRIVQL